jgi:hypothetical protein
LDFRIIEILEKSYNAAVSTKVVT